MKEDATNDGTAADNDANTALLYRDRTWTEVENPVQSRDDDTNFSEVLYRNGWMFSQTIGDADGISVDLYQRRLDAELCRYRWLAEYNTSGICKTIVIQRFQDLIDFLAHVSSTMLAVVLPGDIAYILDDLLDKTPHRVDKKRQEQWRSITKPPNEAKKEAKP